MYEQDFYDGSYGFRPGRSAHQALEALWQQTMQIHGGWILDVDIRKFLDRGANAATPFLVVTHGQTSLPMAPDRVTVLPIRKALTEH